MRVTTLSVLAGLWAAPATACMTGPVPVTFAGHTAQLSSYAKGALRYYAEMRGDRGNNRLLVIFYGGLPSRLRATALLEDRRRSVRSYLLARGVPADAISIVVSRRTAPNFLTYDGKALAPASVELTNGCGA